MHRRGVLAPEDLLSGKAARKAGRRSSRIPCPFEGRTAVAPTFARSFPAAGSRVRCRSAHPAWGRSVSGLASTRPLPPAPLFRERISPSDPFTRHPRCVDARPDPRPLCFHRLQRARRDAAAAGGDRALVSPAAGAGEHPGGQPPHRRFHRQIIAVDAAARHGIRIDWRIHARIGVPVTLATLALAAAWFLLRRPR